MHNIFTGRQNQPVSDIHQLHLDMLTPQRTVQFAWLQNPLVGYLLTLPLVGTAMLIMLTAINVFHQVYFPGAFFFPFIVIIAHYWKLGPALLAVALSSLMLEYFYLPPRYAFGNIWLNLPNLLPYILMVGTTSIIVNRLGQVQRSKDLAEREAYERASQLETVLGTITDGLAIFDRTGEWVYLNITGQELLFPNLSLNFLRSSRAWNDQIQLYHSDSEFLAEMSRPIARILNGEILQGSQSMDIQVSPQKSTTLCLNISGAPLRCKKGDVVGGVVLFRDVTQQYQRAHDLQEAKDQLELFLSVASHELRTPLTSSIANLHIALSQLTRFPLPPNDQVGKQEHLINKLSTILKSADNQLWKMNRLIGDLVEMSRIQAKKLALDKRPADLVIIVNEVINQQHLIHPQCPLNVSNLAQEPIPVLADVDRIGQVIINYLTNAFKYAGVDRPIDITIQKEGMGARVSVRDYGPGISPEALEQVWERFYRVPGIQVKSGSSIGLGLGLHICRNIIEEHHGHVGVESRQGEGTTFWFILPLSREIILS